MMSSRISGATMDRRIPVLAALAALSACNLPAADKESDGIARAFYGEIRSGADLSRDPHVDPSLATAQAQATLAGVRAWAPGAKPTQIQNSGWSYNTNAGQGTQAQLSHTYVYPGATVHVQTVMRKLPGQSAWTIIGFTANTDSGAPVAVGAPPKSSDE
jgi:hypothetical protein